MNLTLSQSISNGSQLSIKRPSSGQNRESLSVKIKETNYKPLKEYSKTQSKGSIPYEKKDQSEITTECLLDKMSNTNNLMLIDTREIRKYKTGHITKAESMNCTSRSMIVRAKKCLNEFIESRKHSTIVIYNDNGVRCPALNDFIEFVKSHFLVVYFLLGGYEDFVKKSPKKYLISTIPEEKYEQHHFSPTNESNRSTDVLHATMTEILPYLFLGNELDSNDLEILKEKKITHILNVTNNVPFHHEDHFTYERLCASDSNKQDMRAYYEKAIKFIEEARLSNGKILIHCWAGVSRSATIVAAYLLKNTNLNVLETINFLQSKRSIVEPNFNFLGQLERFYLDLQAGIEKRSETFLLSVEQEAKKQAEMLEKLRLSSNSSSSDDNNTPPQQKPFFIFIK